MGNYLDIIRQAEEAHRLVDRTPATQPAPMPTTDTRQAAPVPPPIIQAGSQITWQGADLTMQTGCVDFLYTDKTATRWACVSIGKSWAFVNLKIAKVGTP